MALDTSKLLAAGASTSKNSYYSGLLEEAKAYNATAFPEEHARWQRSFMCNRCGGVFAI